ncbi:TetR/AcrR family transcriptional regulator [Caenibacillus caldisaponilyticus]|uniref:TetR/AcrR family transcriptional regulator n=1 Tax=Caenibacillus caldisaponilyticus TaxID=1674942 RepID=UPI0009882FB8|nr:TetR/AcrR family transcriptional regulator [Caenibacillus caldisaponilyticus]
MTFLVFWSAERVVPIDKRTRILAAAERSFMLFGYKGTTMEQVAKMANVAKGTIYLFFKNKEDLFGEIVQKFIAMMRQRAEAAIDPNDTFFNNLQRVLYDVLSFRKEHQLALKLTQEVRDIGTDAARAALDEFENAVISFIEQFITKAINNGKITPCHPRLTAFVMFKLYIALVFEWETKYGQPLSEQEIAELFDRYLVHGLQPRQAEER